MKSVAVIGGGISGLCCAYWLRKRGLAVSLFEKSDSVGGTMKTIHDGGWLVETGPNSALATTPLFEELFTELGILPLRRYADDAASKRYIVRDGALHPLPMGPGSFLFTSLWSAKGKLRLLKEPFVGRAQKEESIAEFVERRLGREFLDYAIDPFVAGVYAGNPESLSVQTAFPKLYALEENYGGLIRGAIGSRRERKRRKEVAKDRAKLFSFVDGMETFPQAIARSLGTAVHPGARVERVIPMRAGRYPVYTLTAVEGGERSTVQTDAVVFASPATATAEIIRPIDPGTASVLDAIYYPPVAEVFLGFRTDQIPRALDGFGFLVPKVERRRILGTIWSSSLFPGRSPEGTVALTSFVGGARNPELVSLDDAGLTVAVTEELQTLLGVTGEPVYRKVIRWERAIPQYNLGYQKVLKSIDAFEDNFRGAFICSNFRGGIAVGDCVMNAEKIARRIAGYLGGDPADGSAGTEQMK